MAKSPSYNTTAERVRVAKSKMTPGGLNRSRHEHAGAPPTPMDPPPGPPPKWTPRSMYDKSITDPERLFWNSPVQGTYTRDPNHPAAGQGAGRVRHY